MRRLIALARTWLGSAGSWMARVKSEIRARKALVFIAIVVPMGTLVAAVLGDDNPALSIFAGVIVGAIVTAVATWVIAPDVERQVRKQVQREAALAAIAPKLFDSHTDALSARNDVLGRPDKAVLALEAIRDRSQEIATLSLATRDTALVQACWDWRSDCFSAVLSVRAVPAPPERKDGRLLITLVDHDTLDPYEKDAFLACERVSKKCKELLRQVLGALEMDLPPFLKTTHEKQLFGFDSPAEQLVQRMIVAGALRSYGENEESASDVGRLLRKLAERDSEVRSELERLKGQWLDSARDAESDAALGAIVIEMAADEVEEETTSDYPRSTRFTMRHVLANFLTKLGPADDTVGSPPEGR